MNTWILVVLYGITGWGYAGYRHVEFPNEASCYKALESMKITGQKQQAGEDDEQIIVYCKPKEAKE